MSRGGLWRAPRRASRGVEHAPREGATGAVGGRGGCRRRKKAKPVGANAARLGVSREVLSTRREGAQQAS